MKQLTILFSLLFISFAVFGQDEGGDSGNAMASLADIMNVAPKTVTLSEDAEKNQAEYEETYNDEKKKLDDALAKENEKYTKEVGDIISKFTKVLDKAIEQDVENEKQLVGTKVNSLTFGHRKNKKLLLTTFNNKLSKALREAELPKSITKDKEKELTDMSKEYRENFDEEFDTNQMVIKQFKSTEHLTTDETGTTAPSEEEGGE